MFVESVKPLKDDPLSLVLLITSRLYNNKIFKTLQYFVCALHATLVLITINHVLRNWNLDIATQYVASCFGEISALIFNVTQMVKQSTINKIQNDLFKIFWSYDCVSTDLQQKLFREAHYVKILIIINTIIGILTGLVLTPVGEEELYRFELLFFKTHYPNYYPTIKAIYVMSLPIMAFTMTYLAHLFAYFTFHMRGQVFLAIELMENIAFDYDHLDDDVLYHDESYQLVMKKRMRFLIRRHIEINSVADFANEMTTEFVPSLCIAGILMGLSMMCYWYMGLIFGLWCYIQMLFWIFTTFVTGGIFFYCGQEVEDLSESIYYKMYETPWLTLNKSNALTIQIALMRAFKPIQLKFLQSYAVNYDLGVRMLKLLYSFAAVIHRFRDYNLAKY